MTLGAPNTLPNFKCKNITIKDSASEKLVPLLVTNLTLRNTLIQYVKRQTWSYMLYIESPDFCIQSSMFSTIKSLLNYCRLVRIFCYWRLCIKFLRLLLKNYNDVFQDLLRSSGDISILQRRINSFNRSIQIYT